MKHLHKRFGVRDDKVAILQESEALHKARLSRCEKSWVQLEGSPLQESLAAKDAVSKVQKASRNPSASYRAPLSISLARQKPRMLQCYIYEHSFLVLHKARGSSHTPNNTETAYVYEQTRY